MTAPRMASHQALDGEERAPTSAVHADGLIGVGRARRVVTTPGRAPRPVLLIDPDERENHPGRNPGWVRNMSGPGRCRAGFADWRLGATHRLAAMSPVTAPASESPVAARRAWVIAFLNSSNWSPAAPGPVLTRYAPTGTCRRPSTNSPRSWRRRWFLATALPTFRLMAKANCGLDQEGCSRYVTETDPDLPRLPDRRNAEKVCRERIGSIRVLCTGSLDTGEVTPRADDAPSVGATE
jgi:hypothetical protein